MSEPDAWRTLRRFTAARIGLGRTGVSLPTDRALEFQAAHAAARTAVHEKLDVDALAAALAGMFSGVAILATEAGDRTTYLKRPDLGRKLNADSLAALKPSPCNVAVVICDGLSARAVSAHAAALLADLLPRLAADGFTVGPLTIVKQGRVAVGDAVGEALGADLVLMLIGERPGLSASDSLGAYITHGPCRGRSDAQRNCISNIRPEGLTCGQAAYRAHYLISEALSRGYSGVALKDDTVAQDAIGGGSAGFLLSGKN